MTIIQKARLLQSAKYYCRNISKFHISNSSFHRHASSRCIKHSSTCDETTLNSDQVPISSTIREKLVHSVIVADSGSCLISGSNVDSIKNICPFIKSPSIYKWNILENRQTTWHQSFSTGTTDNDNYKANDAWESLVNYELLSQLEIKIHERHKNAVQKGELMYMDPQTGYYVMTRLAHIERGNCCGNACRHCPYGQVKVEDEKKKKKFNSAFYV